MSNEEMDRAYREDSACERDCREAVRALHRLLDHQRISQSKYCGEILQLQTTLQRQADHIVAVWD